MTDFQGYTLKQHICCFIGALAFACAGFYLDTIVNAPHFSQQSKPPTEFHAHAMNLPTIE